MNIFIKYLYWQLILVPKKVLAAVRNYLAFGCYFFSIKETLCSLFAPWKRYAWDYGRGFDIGRYFEVFASNVIARIIGFVMRLFLIALFAIYEAAALCIGTALFAASIAYPYLLIGAIIYGFKYI